MPNIPSYYLRVCIWRAELLPHCCVPAAMDNKYNNNNNNSNGKRKIDNQ